MLTYNFLTCLIFITNMYKSRFCGDNRLSCLHNDQRLIYTFLFTIYISIFSIGKRIFRRFKWVNILIDKKGRSSLREENKNNWPNKSVKQDNKQRTQLMVLQTMTQAVPHLVQSKYMPNKIKHVTFLIILQFLSMKVKLAVAVFRNQTRGLALHFTYPVPLAGVNLQNNL